jgi:hypothetical protein
MLPCSVKPPRVADVNHVVTWTLENAKTPRLRQADNGPLTRVFAETRGTGGVTAIVTTGGITVTVTGTDTVTAGEMIGIATGTTGGGAATVTIGGEATTAATVITSALRFPLTSQRSSGMCMSPVPVSVGAQDVPCQCAAVRPRCRVCGVWQRLCVSLNNSIHVTQ